MTELVLYTDSFPYSSSETFLETEILYLCEIFDIVSIQPLNGNGVMRVVPVNVRVFDPIGAKRCSKVRMYICGFLNFHLLLSEKSLKRNLLSVSLFKAVKYIGFGHWIKNKIKKKLVTGNAIHYSYWLNFSAFALALLKREKKISHVVSRAHRFDLYTGKGEPSLDFLKSFTIKYVNKIFFISENGLNFISELYPEYSQKYYLSRLGTSDPGFACRSGNSEQHYLVSCSSLKPFKRVGLLLESLICLNKKYPDFELTWFHIGDGEEFAQTKERAKQKLGQTKINCNLTGSYSNHEVIEFYRNQFVDVFINLSETEGIPVSIMEAQSCWIPVLATAAGGTPEIVNNDNGILLDINIRPEELAIVIYQVFLNRGNWNRKRILSRENWELKFNAEKNYRSFAHELLRLL